MLVQKTSKLSIVSDGGDHDHLAQLQSHGSGLAAEVGQVVFVAVAYFLDHAMDSQSFEQASDLRCGFVREVLGAQLLVGETTDEELALQQGAKQTGVLF